MEWWNKMQYFCNKIVLVTLDLSPQISLGDVQSNYLLTTAENELGVVVAHSEAGEGLRKRFLLHTDQTPTLLMLCSSHLPAGAQMVPISWCEMQCPRTHSKEFRKVARVQPEYLQA